MNISVIKRDGTKEPFSVEKVMRVVQAAGLNTDQAEMLGQHLIAWVKSSSLTDISSLAIRDRVITELRKVDPYAANLFEWYQKTKEKK